MPKSTRERLVIAAAQLLDAGGVPAVTLRAVGEAVGLSHNAPYKHFEDRGALLAAVVEEDMRALAVEFRRLAASHLGSLTALKRARAAFIAYGRTHPARYRLLYGDGAAGGALAQAGRETFDAFAALVSRCQREGTLPDVSLQTLTALIYATDHGLIDLELTGSASAAKGLGEIEAVTNMLLAALAGDL